MINPAENSPKNINGVNINELSNPKKYEINELSNLRKIFQSSNCKGNFILPRVENFIIFY